MTGQPAGPDSPDDRPALVSTLGRPLAPHLAIAPAGRLTGWTVRVGRELLASGVWSNPAGAGLDARTAPLPTPGLAIRDLIAELEQALNDYATRARNWWNLAGTEPAGRLPYWVILADIPAPSVRRSRGQRVGVRSFYSHGAAAFIAGALIAWAPPTHLIVTPADRLEDRWQQAAGGSGERADYWPAALLDGRPGVRAGRAGKAGHRGPLRAAWSAAGDALAGMGARPPWAAPAAAAVLPGRPVVRAPASEIPTLTAQLAALRGDQAGDSVVLPRTYIDPIAARAYVGALHDHVRAAAPADLSDLLAAAQAALATVPRLPGCPAIPAVDLASRAVLSGRAAPHLYDLDLTRQLAELARESIEDKEESLRPSRAP